MSTNLDGKAVDQHINSHSNKDYYTLKASVIATRHWFLNWDVKIILQRWRYILAEDWVWKQIFTETGFCKLSCYGDNSDITIHGGRINQKPCVETNGWVQWQCPQPGGANCLVIENSMNSMLLGRYPLQFPSQGVDNISFRLSLSNAHVNVYNTWRHFESNAYHISCIHCGVSWCGDNTRFLFVIQELSQRAQWNMTNSST